MMEVKAAKPIQPYEWNTIMFKDWSADQLTVLQALRQASGEPVRVSSIIVGGQVVTCTAVTELNRVLKRHRLAFRIKKAHQRGHWRYAKLRVVRVKVQG